MTAADWEVPLPRMKRSPVVVGAKLSMNEPGTRSPWTSTAGATRSTPRVSVPRSAKAGTVQSHGTLEPLVSAAPTAITSGLRAGNARSDQLVPSFPPAATTTMPFWRATSTAWESGSCTASAVEGTPYARVRTLMFIPFVLRCCTAQSIAAMTWVTSTAPSTAPTLTLTMRAPGAIPA